MRTAALLLSAFVLASALATVASASPAIRSIVGSWSGTLHQQGQEAGAVRFTITRYGSSTPTGRVVYPGLGCAGRWTFLGLDRAGTAFRFREVIDRGEGPLCDAVGVVRLRVLGPRLLHYRWTDGRLISATVVARR